jgi:hypothetical protein
LGEGGHDGQHRCAHRPLGVQALGEAAESDPSRRQLVDDGENVLGIASESVQFPDGEPAPAGASRFFIRATHERGVGDGIS